MAATKDDIVITGEKYSATEQDRVPIPVEGRQAELAEIGKAATLDLPEGAPAIGDKVSLGEHSEATVTGYDNHGGKPWAQVDVQTADGGVTPSNIDAHAQVLTNPDQQSPQAQ